jgi:hypothetical protein
MGNEVKPESLSFNTGLAVAAFANHNDFVPIDEKTVTNHVRECSQCQFYIRTHANESLAS